MKWSATLYIKPKPVQSIRFGGYHPKKVQMYKAQLAGLIERYAPQNELQGPLALEVVFVYPFTAKDKRTGAQRLWADSQRCGDITNLLKPLEDAMQTPKGAEKIRVYQNDARIVKTMARKIKERDSEGEIRVTVYELEDRDYEN